MPTTKKENPLGTKPLRPLLRSLAIPAIIANVVSALYNFVDQIFIGQGVGMLGNAATNVSFPLTTICLAIGLMMGIGSAAGFNLQLGKENREKARKFGGTCASITLISGIILCIFIRIFLRPMLIFFGATKPILPYALDYAGITSLGMPFFLFMNGTDALVRADGNAKFSMFSIVSGAVLNIILDYVFIFIFDFGIRGAAWATVIGQVLSASLLASYLPRFRSVDFKPSDFIPNFKVLLETIKLGANAFIFQSSYLIVQIVLNNVLRTYGSQSIYGADMPIAVAGIVLKINVIFVSFIIGLINGSQPICSYNYGARKYARVRKTMKLFLTDAFIISLIAWLIFQLFPKQIIALFGEAENELYYDYAVRFMRFSLFGTIFNGIQISTATFFPSIDKAAKGAILSFSKQIVFIMPLLLILPKFFGLKGVRYTFPLADLLGFIFAVFLLKDELKRMPKKDFN